MDVKQGVEVIDIGPNTPRQPPISREFVNPSLVLWVAWALCVNLAILVSRDETRASIHGNTALL